MAPGYVLEYLAAHEAAHLRHMNHGPKFWKLVAKLDPNWQKAEVWLKRHGPNLRRYG
jgi:predicted metal-dependent hydrolase